MFIYKTAKPLIQICTRNFKLNFSSLLVEEATIIDCKDEIVYFKNFQPEILKYQSLLRTKDKESFVFLLSLNDNISCGPLLKKIKGQDAAILKEKQLELIANEENFEFLSFSHENMGKIVDFQGNLVDNDQEPLMKKEFTYKIQEVFKAETNIPRRKRTDGQLWTGSIL